MGCELEQRLLRPVSPGEDVSILVVSARTCRVTSTCTGWVCSRTARLKDRPAHIQIYPIHVMITMVLRTVHMSNYYDGAINSPR